MRRLEVDAILSKHVRFTLGALAFAIATTALAGAKPAGNLAVYGSGGGPALLPTGQWLTATYPQGAYYQRLATGLRPDGNADADDAVSSAISRDGKTLLVLTSGFNIAFNYQKPNGAPILFDVLNPLTGLSAGDANPNNCSYVPTYVCGKNNQAEFLFIFDVSSGTPVRKQLLFIPDTYSGLAWEPEGGRFYVSGGIDDRVLVFKVNPKSQVTTYVPDPPFFILGHNSKDTQPFPNYDGGILAGTPAGKAVPALVTGAVAAGIGLSADGKTLVVANYENASATITDTHTRKVLADVKFTPPGSSVGHGEFPYWVAVKSDANGAYEKAYVTSLRDDEIDVITGTKFTGVIPVGGGPNKTAWDPTGRYLYVANGNDDSVSVIDSNTDKEIHRFSIARPGDVYKGSLPNSIAVSPDGTRLYVTLGGENAVAVVDAGTGHVVGRIPTGWYPSSVTTSKDGTHLFIVNQKSNGGPNPGQTYYSWNTPYGISLNTTNQNNYTWEIEKGGLLSEPTPDDSELHYLSALVDANNNLENRGLDPAMAYLQKRIKHVIYIVNENRTFDQVLGDLGNGSNGDSKLAFFNKKITPNLHALAADFVTLDNFYDASETSGVGWNWCLQGHTNDFIEKEQPVDYGNSNGYGVTYDWQGIVQHINLGLPATGGHTIFDTRITGILDPSGSSTILPGYKDPAANEGADDLRKTAVGGYIWESVARAGLTFRNYGLQDDLTYYGSGTPFDPTMVRNPYPKTPQSSPSTPSIRASTDIYYRAFDERYPDIYRIEEWNREFNNYVAKNNFPSLEVMTIPHDHTGSFSQAIEGLNTPELELADHDYAIGKLVEAVSHSKYWDSTAIIMIEDDPQDGQDHVEAHRSIAHVISAYTKTNYVDHTTYTTLSAVRTVTDLLGVNHLGFQDANAQAMTTVFTTTPSHKPYTAIIPGSLCAAPVAKDLVPACSNPSVRRTQRVALRHDGAWWAANTVGLNFREPDHLPAQAYNQLLEFGITGHGSMPSTTAMAAPPPADADGDGDGK
jgi:YVTN family beta-propeller protein